MILYNILISFLSTLGAQIDYNTLIQPIFNASPFECAADFTGDGNVKILDLVQIVNYILDN